MATEECMCYFCDELMSVDDFSHQLQPCDETPSEFFSENCISEPIDQELVLLKCSCPHPSQTSDGSQGKMTYSCKFADCKSTFQTQGGKITHEYYGHGPVEICLFPNCGYRGRHLAKHISFKHENRAKAVCEKCGIEVNLNSLKPHHQICFSRNEEKVWPCFHDDCEELFRNKIQRDKHMRRHEPKIVCPREDCGSKVSPAYLSTHIRNVHENKIHRPMAQCPWCKKEYRNDNLIRHLVKVHPDKDSSEFQANRKQRERCR